jgi:hypothetical protein
VLLSATRLLLRRLTSILLALVFSGELVPLLVLLFLACRFIPMATRLGLSSDLFDSCSVFSLAFFFLALAHNVFGGTFLVSRGENRVCCGVFIQEMGLACRFQHTAMYLYITFRKRWRKEPRRVEGEKMD